MSDYKYEAQLLAEQKAEELYDKDFYSLPSDIQDRLYRGAMEDWTEQQYAAAEARQDDR